MPAQTHPINLSEVKALPLAQRRSLTELQDILVEPAEPPPPCNDLVRQQINTCAKAIREAHQRNAAVMLIYGAHLIKNGAQLIINQMLQRGLLSHIATNGAGIIHDWEYSFQGKSTESVRDNVATGTFGTWDETSRNIHLALLVGALQGDGLGRSVGRLVHEDGLTLPEPTELETTIRNNPSDPLTPARAELLVTMKQQGLQPGRLMLLHRFRNASVLSNAFHQGVPFTVHPGIGYDIISNHPIFNGAAIGRAATTDFRWFAGAVEKLDGGVVLSIGSAIMGPQVFEKTISCVNNIRLNNNRPVVKDHHIFVVDLQDGGNWDWTQGEPPKENAAYYLRFCKSYSRMGGAMHYVQSDNIAFLHNLFHALQR